MRMLYINDENKFPTCLVYAWMFNENKQKSYKQFATFTDERGDDFCKQLEKNKDFISWVRNPWTDEVNITRQWHSSCTRCGNI